jgi:hypothetical protein
MEFVGVGHNQKDHLARASVVNYHGEVVYDVYVKPNVKVTGMKLVCSQSFFSPFFFVLGFFSFFHNYLDFEQTVHFFVSFVILLCFASQAKLIYCHNYVFECLSIFFLFLFRFSI